MVSLIAHAQKLKGRSFDELRTRGTQAVRARIEAAGLSEAAREPSDRHLFRLFDRKRFGAPLTREALYLHFSTRTSCPFFPGVADRQATVAEIERRFPNAADRVAKVADRIADGELDVLGRRVFYRDSPDWTLEPSSGCRAPAVHWSRIRYLDPRVAGDCKVTWELSRHQYFVTLGRAYWLTGDERYAHVFAAHLSSWMDANPPKIGINWTSSLEIAFRASSWLWALYFFRESARLDERLLIRALKFLYVHARHLETYLSTYFSPNTHLTGEALGLLQLGVALPEFRRAEQWTRLGARVLEEQLARQVFPDGVYFEQSTYYHRYTVDFYQQALVLADANRLPLAGVVRERLPALLDHLMYITRPDGRSPLIGDDDGGRAAIVGQRAPNDFRDTLAIGATLFDRGDYAYVAGPLPEEVVWLLGPAGAAAYDRLSREEPRRTSYAFAHSGYFVMRQHWDAESDYAIVRCGPHGTGSGAHAHADALALEVVVGGTPALVDSGTATYADADTRAYFRGTSAHNTVVVDGVSSSASAESPFAWRSAARGVARRWVTHPWIDYFDGDHDGYRRLEAPVTHRRSVLFVKNGAYWIVRDVVRSASEHRVDLHWHWASGFVLSVVDDHTLIARSVESIAGGLLLQVFGSGGCFSCDQRDVSPSYGVRQSSAHTVFCCEPRREHELITLLAPRTLVTQACWSRDASSSGGTLTIEHGQGTDVITTEEHLTWLRRSPYGDVVMEASIGADGLRTGIPCVASAE